MSTATAITTPTTAEELEELMIAAIAAVLGRTGVAVAASVGSRSLGDREVVYLAQPHLASDESRREFAKLSCRWWDSAGQFHPAWPEMSYADEAKDLAKVADADPGVCYLGDGTLHSEWRSGAIRLD